MEDNFDHAEIIPVEDIEITSNVNPSNASNQIVNFITFNNEVDIAPKNTDAIATIVDLYNDLNSKYGFKLEFDITTLANNFKDIINPKRRKLFELYLSEAFGRSRLIFFQRGLVTIMDLMEQVSKPSVLRDPSMDLDYKLNMMQRLLSLMEQFEQMYANVKIDDTEVQLRRTTMDEEENTGSKISSSKEVLEVMEQLNNMILKQ